MPEKAEAAPIKNLQDSGKIVIFASQLINNKTVNENIRGNKMEPIKVKVIVERGGDGKYSAYMDYYELDFGLSGFGDTAKAAIADFYDAFEQEKNMCAAEGKQPPELEFDIRYDMSSFLNYFAGILSKSGIEKITGINQKQLWHYSSGNRKPKTQTVHKIQERLHHFGRELQQLQFVD